MINIKLLKYLQEIAKAGSIRKAATLLNISSSALNRQILALESQLGTSLFERLPKRLRLTASGEVLMDYAQAMAKEHSRALGRIAALQGTQQGQVRIATMGGLINGPMLRLATDFIEQRNRVLVKVEIMANAESIAARVLAGESDLGLGYNIVPNPALRVLHSIEVEIGAVMGAKHPLRKRKDLKLAHCLDHPIATGGSTTAIRSLVEHAFLSANLPLQPSIETDSIEVMKQAANDGRCITFLNPLDICAEMARGELVCVRLHERHFPRPRLHLVVRSRGALEPTASRLAEELRNCMMTHSENTSAPSHKLPAKTPRKLVRA